MEGLNCQNIDNLIAACIRKCPQVMLPRPRFKVVDVHMWIVHLAQLSLGKVFPLISNIHKLIMISYFNVEARCFVLLVSVESDATESLVRPIRVDSLQDKKLGRS